MLIYSLTINVVADKYQGEHYRSEIDRLERLLVSMKPAQITRYLAFKEVTSQNLHRLFII